jgi:hypothetical protein
LFFGDHLPPHFYAVYGEHVGLFDIKTLEMFEGDLPTSAKRLVLQWPKTNQDQLLEILEKQEFRKLPALP